MPFPDSIARFIDRWSKTEATASAKEREIAEILAALGRAHQGDTAGTYVR